MKIELYTRRMKTFIIIAIFVLIILMMADTGGTPSNHDPDDDPN